MEAIDELPILNRMLPASQGMKRAVPRDHTTKSQGPDPEAQAAETASEGMTLIAMREDHLMVAIERAVTLVPGRIEMLAEREDHTTTTENINLAATLATETTVTAHPIITRAETIITPIETTIEGVDHLKTVDSVAAIIDTHPVETRVATKPPITAEITKAAIEITKIDTLLATI